MEINWQNWNDTRKAAEYLLDEYPKLLLSTLKTILRNTS